MPSAAQNPQAYPTFNAADQFRLRLRLADELAAERLVEFTDNPKHRRSKLVRLTPKVTRVTASSTPGFFDRIHHVRRSQRSRYLTYRWFCRVGPEGDVPDHATFSKTRRGRFRDANLLRDLFETVVRRCMGRPGRR